MNENSHLWVIKLETDQVKGPYSTEAISKMISSGAYSGNEQVCRYPEGEWKSLSKQPEFYEVLLESLENPVEVDLKKAQKMDAETVIRMPVRKEDSASKGLMPDELKKLFEDAKAEEEKKIRLQVKKMSTKKN